MKKFKLLTAALAITMMFAGAAQADEYTDTLDILLQKGILSKQEHSAKIEAHRDRLENKEFQTSRIDKDVKDSNNYRLSRVNDGAVMENGLGIKSKDGNTTAQFTGRVHMDYRSYTQTFSSGQSTDPYQDALEVRRGRFGVRGQIAKDFKYLLLANFGNDVGASSTTSTIDEFWFNYAAVAEAQLQVGTFKMPFSLEQLTSSNNIDFMERSLIGQAEGEFIPAKETGVMLHGIPKPGFTYAVALSRGRANKSTTVDGVDVVGRVTTNIAEVIQNKDFVAHLGAAYSTGNVKTGVAPASGRTEGRQQSAWFTGSSALSGDTARTRQGIEAAFAWKGLKVQGEQFNFKYDPATGADREITGHYVQAIYNITGENHNYKDGTFGWIKPNTAFTSGGRGAWQVGVRASEFNAEDITVATGKANLATSITYGVTWFLNDNVRLMANYVDTKFNKPVGTSGARVDGEQAVMLRGQISF
jgi:phosphate-selective porin OprO and OprP